MTPTNRPPGRGVPVLGVLAALLAVAVVVGGLVAFRRDPPADPPAAPPSSPSAPAAADPAGFSTGGGHWVAVPTPPLSTRWGAVGGWTGREVVVVGGSGGAPCLLDCDARLWRRDGAAFDPPSRTWRRLPPAPVPIGPRSIAAAAGAALVVSAGRRWLILRTGDPRADRWSTLPAPGLRAVVLTAAGGRVYAFDRLRRGAVLDLARTTWRPLPRPSSGARGARPVAFRGGVALVGGRPAQRGAATVVETWRGGAWRRTEQSTPGRLDPATGRWVRLPPAPAGRRNSTWLGLPLTDGRPATSGRGYVWDPSGRQWDFLGSPVSPTETYSTVVYSGPTIYVFGGLRINRSGSDETTLGRRAWAWSPARRS